MEMSEWKSIKVRKEIYEKLKGMGVGISKAIEILVKAQKKQIERRFVELEKAADELVKYMFEKGVFDIKITGASVTSVEEIGSTVRIEGCIDVYIPDEDIRRKIVEMLGGERSEQGEEGSDENI